jgi:hypothetical protein
MVTKSSDSFWKTGFPISAISVDSKPWFFSRPFAIVAEASSLVEVIRTVAGAP